MPDDDDKQYYRNPEYTNQGLGKEIGERKRPSGSKERRPTSEYDLNPVKGETAVNLELEKRLAGTEQPADDITRKKTLHDPRKFEELMKERAAQIQTPEVQKITNPEIEALRQSSLKGNSDQVKAKQKVNSFVQNITSTLGGMFSSNKKVTMCDNYGHIAPAHWRGDFPNCTECGKQINAQSELRKSSATQKIGDIKPHDNRLDIT